MLTKPSPDEIYDYIRAYQREEGYPPTIREMSAHFDRSTSVIWSRMRFLKQQGRIQHLKGRPRAIRLVG